MVIPYFDLEYENFTRYRTVCPVSVFDIQNMTKHIIKSRQQKSRWMEKQTGSGWLARKHNETLKRGRKNVGVPDLCRNRENR